MKTLCYLSGLAVFSAALVLGAAGFAPVANAADSASQVTVATQPAPAGGSAITFVGRGNRAAEVGKDGNVTEVTADKLVLRNRGKSVARIVAPPEAPGETKAGEQPKPGEEAKKPTDEEKAAAVAKVAKAEGEKAVQEALKEADVKTIEEMRKGRYMWFFDENGKVMTNEELDRRIANKDISKIKAMNDDRDEWTPRSAGKSPESGDGSPEKK